MTSAIANLKQGTGKPKEFAVIMDSVFYSNSRNELIAHEMPQKRRAMIENSFLYIRCISWAQPSMDISEIIFQP